MAQAYLCCNDQMQACFYSVNVKTSSEDEYHTINGYIFQNQKH